MEYTSKRTGGAEADASAGGEVVTLRHARSKLARSAAPDSALGQQNLSSPVARLNYFEYQILFLQK